MGRKKKSDIDKNKGVSLPRHKQIDMSIPDNCRTFRLIGYCPDCHKFLSENDIEEGKKYIFNCFGCGLRGKVKDLLSELPKEDNRPRNKRDYLDSTTIPVKDFWGDSGFHISEESEPIVGRARIDTDYYGFSEE